MSNALCRWGILGAAGIARKNWQAIRHSGNGRLVAVASRSLEKAAAFVEECQAQVPHHPVPEALGSYEALLSRSDIDAVYIPLPTGLRKEWVLAAAAAGKHVLCEKPCAVNAGDLEEMVEACARADVQFMDGVMFMHNDRLARLREELDTGEAVGEIRRLGSQFSFRGDEAFFARDIRANAALEPQGSLGDLGWYCLRFFLWAMRYEMPESLVARLHREHKGVPLTLSGELHFAGGVSAGFYCSFEVDNQQWLDISGTQGRLRLEDFVLPYYGAELAYEVVQDRFRVEGCRFHMERHPRRVATAEYSDGHPTSQEAKLFRKFGDIVLSGQTESHWPDIALKTQRLLDACLLSAREGGREVRF